MIRPATHADRDAVLDIFQTVIRDGDTFAFDPDLPRWECERVWFADGAEVYVAESGGSVYGSFFIKPNQPGLGNHVANGGFMVDPRARGHGLGREMGMFAIDEAARLGYEAMQFNFVVSTNQGAVQLWLDLGFREVGRIPNAFRHRHHGRVDVLIMYRELGPPRSGRPPRGPWR